MCKLFVIPLNFGAACLPQNKPCSKEISQTKVARCQHIHILYYIYHTSWIQTHTAKCEGNFVGWNRLGKHENNITSYFTVSVLIDGLKGVFPVLQVTQMCCLTVGKRVCQINPSLDQHLWNKKRERKERSTRARLGSESSFIAPVGERLWSAGNQLSTN